MRGQRILFHLPLPLILLTGVLIRAAAQSPAVVQEAFDQAAREFGVPADVLKGVAFAETRWQQLTWAPGDTASCMGMPRPYGIMSLWDNDYFGHSLRTAAALIGKDPETLKQDVAQNIRGAAALLRKLHNELPLPEGTAPQDVESWRSAIVAYCGIPQPDLAQQHALDIYGAMAKGYHAYHIDWAASPVKLDLVRSSVEKVWHEVRQEGLQKTVNQPDYPYAKWAQAYPGHWYTTGYPKEFVVIHDMEGYYLSVISYFQQSSTQASIFYCINGLMDNASDAPAGEITQMVEEKYWAWHVRCWNRYMFGIEHEGFVSNPAWYTDTLYRASAKLTAYLCDKYGITIDRDHIIGHQEWQNSSWVNWVYNTYNPDLQQRGIPALDPTCNNHTDPGPYWDWTYYMDLVRSYAAPPRIASVAPSPGDSDVRAYKDIVITFSTFMDTSATDSAFSITPPTPGAISWSSDKTVLTFRPTTRLAFSTTYTVTVDSSARGLIHLLDGNGDGTEGDAFQFSFTTQSSDTSAPVILHIYPSPGDTAVPLYPELYVLLDEPVDSTSLASLVLLQDSAGVPVAPVTLERDSLNDRGILRLLPASLDANATYRFLVLPGIRDLYGNVASATADVTFRTLPTTVTAGTLYENFDFNNRSWQEPITQPGTTLVDSASTSFSLSNERVKAGTMAGRLAYSFTHDSGGAVVLDAGSRPAITNYLTIGVWVYGDESENQLHAVFQPADQSIDLGPVTWRGWKFLEMSLDSVTGVTKQFSDFILEQADSGSKTGVLYFDDMRLNATVTGARRPAVLGPTVFRLEQNYPNPFNPETRIAFDLPSTSEVTLVILDMLGRRVRTLISGERPAGRFTVTWNGRDDGGNAVASGAYFYRIQAGSNIMTRKMMLIR